MSVEHVDSVDMQQNVSRPMVKGETKDGWSDIDAYLPDLDTRCAISYGSYVATLATIVEHRKPTESRVWKPIAREVLQHTSRKRERDRISRIELLYRFMAPAKLMLQVTPCITIDKTCHV